MHPSAHRERDRKKGKEGEEGWEGRRESESKRKRKTLAASNASGRSR